MAKITAVNMHRNWSVVPHVAQFNEADVTDLEDFMNDLKAESKKKGTDEVFNAALVGGLAGAAAGIGVFALLELLNKQNKE